MKIPIKGAIDSGAWFKCRSGYDAIDQYEFQIKVLSFDKVNLAEIDNIENIELDLGSGALRLMKIQVINLNKTVVSSNHIQEFIHLIDQDDFAYEYTWDHHLLFYSNYAKLSGLEKFYGVEFMPKIKYTGAIAYYLPEDNEAEYYISVKDGNIQEV